MNGPNNYNFKNKIHKFTHIDLTKTENCDEKWVTNMFTVERHLDGHLAAGPVVVQLDGYVKVVVVPEERTQRLHLLIDDGVVDGQLALVIVHVLDGTGR